MVVLFLMSNFRLNPGFKITFEHNSVRKNLFLIACFCWDSRLSLREMDQKFKFGGTIGYGESYLYSVFFLLQRIQTTCNFTRCCWSSSISNRKGLDYCYLIGWGPNCCLLAHVTGLLFCIHVKIFLPPFSIQSTFESVCLWL